MKKEEAPAPDKGYELIEDALDLSKKLPPKSSDELYRNSSSKEADEEGDKNSRRVAAKACGHSF